MSDRKHRRDMSEYERAIDWRDRVSPRWWRAVFITFGVAGVLFVAGSIIRALGS